MVPENDPEQTPPNPASTQVTIDKAEFDRLQAENRRAAKERRDREAAQAADEARAARDAADAEQLRQQLAERDRRDTLRDEITVRGLTPSQAKLVLRLAEVGDPAFEAAASIDAISADYPDIFAPTPALPEPPVPTPSPVRRAGPAPAPKPTTTPFQGYVSHEEYMATPHAVRLTPQFRQRVDASRAYWPTTFDARNLPAGNG